MLGHRPEEDAAGGTVLWAGALIIAVFALFLLALTETARASSGEELSLTGLDSVPIMRGLREDYAFAAPVERPGERVARASLSGWPMPMEMLDFYAAALPAKGWRLVRLQQDETAATALPVMILEDGTHVSMYQTDQKVMTLSALRSGRRTYLSVEIWAKDEADETGDGVKIVSELH